LTPLLLPLRFWVSGPLSLYLSIIEDPRPYNPVIRVWPLGTRPLAHVVRVCELATTLLPCLPLSVALLPALLLAPLLLPGLFEVLFLIARVKCEVGARWGGVALRVTLLRLSVAGGSWLYRQGSDTLRCRTRSVREPVGV